MKTRRRPVQSFQTMHVRDHKEIILRMLKIQLFFSSNSKRMVISYRLTFTRLFLDFWFGDVFLILSLDNFLLGGLVVCAILGGIFLLLLFVFFLFLLLFLLGFLLLRFCLAFLLLFFCFCNLGLVYQIFDLKGIE